MAGAGHQISTLGCVCLFGKGSFGPVDHAIGPQNRAMKIVHAACQGATVVPDFPAFCYAVVVGVYEPNNLWRSAHPNLIAHHGNALREHQVIGKHRACIENAITIRIGQAKHAVWGFFRLNG